VIYLTGYLIYFSTYFSIKLDSNGREISIKISNLEKMGGFSWILGLAIGLISTMFVDIDTAILITSIFPFIGFIISIYLLQTNYIHLSNNDEKNFELNGVSYNSNEGTNLPIKNLLLTLFFISFSNALASTQLVPYLALEGFSASTIFLFSLLSSSSAALTYEKAGKEFNGISSVIKAIRFRALVFLFLAIISVIKICGSLLYITIVGISFIFLGRSWAYLYIDTNSLVLKLERKKISYTNLISSLGNIFGIYLSGILLSFFSYPFEILVSLLAMSIPFITFYDKSKMERMRIIRELYSSGYKKILKHFKT
jgi:hypothetical protein